MHRRPPDEPEEAAVENARLRLKSPSSRYPSRSCQAIPELQAIMTRTNGFNDDEFARHVLAGEPEVDDSKRETRSSDSDKKSETEISTKSERPDPSGAADVRDGQAPAGGAA